MKLFSIVYFALRLKSKHLFFFFSFSAPPGPPAIKSETGKILLDYTEPVTEGGSLTMICETLGGDPLPRVSWWRGTRLIDDIVDEVKLSHITAYEPKRLDCFVLKQRM